MDISKDQLGEVITNKFLKNLYKKLQSYKPQTVGIPQEYIDDCSRILANFYLQKYDLEIKNIAKNSV